jgi:hypothetical protein
MKNGENLSAIGTHVAGRIWPESLMRGLVPAVKGDFETAGRCFFTALLSGCLSVYTGVLQSWLSADR